MKHRQDISSQHSAFRPPRLKMSKRLCSWLQNAATLSLHLMGFILNTSTQPESHITSPSIVKQIAAEMDLTAETPAGPSPECFQSHWQIPTAFGQWLESSSAVLKGQAPN
jgi:hypothetical protein